MLSSGMWIPLRACCGGLQVFSRTSYCSGGGLCLGTLPTPSKEEEEKKRPFLYPPRGLCASSCCAVPALCHTNAPQLWRWRSQRQVAAGDITGLRVSLLVGRRHVEMQYADMLRLYNRFYATLVSRNALIHL